MVYLDIDTMCLGNIRELYDIDLTEKEYAASRDILGKVWYQKDYCNSGVLLLNMKKIRETGLFTRAREMVYNKHMYMPDQSALNALATARTFLPERFNEQRAIKKDTLIKHFCKGIRWILFIPFTYNIKQWHRDKVHSRLKIHQFDDVYEQFDELAEKHDLNL